MSRRTDTGLVIYGPMGCGKTTHAIALAAFFGKTRVADDWKPGAPVPADTLALTNLPCPGAMLFVDAIAVAGINQCAKPTNRVERRA